MHSPSPSELPSQPLIQSQPHSPSQSPPHHLSEAITSDAFSSLQANQIQLIATDMDGTLTANGEFTAALLQAFEALHQQGIEVMIVTGRSAGWVSGLVNYLPVVGAIAENGGLYIDKQSPQPMILPDIPRMSHHRDRLQHIFRILQKRYPKLQPSVDNPYRLTDWTFDIDNFTTEDIAWLSETCKKHTMGFTYSNVQCHLQVPRQNKANGLKRILQQKFAHLTPTQMLTIGDSPNDESLFNTQQFPNSIGVANVSHYLPSLSYHPAYITHKPEVDGFLEVVENLLK
ncbi:MAG: HAD family hydrolase [Cyanobacteria bacterium J06621_11]